MKLNEMIVGIDLGGTIFERNESFEAVPKPLAFAVIKKLVQIVKSVYIVSKVTDRQSMKAYQWFQKHNFFEQTGLTPNKVHFCYEREDKAPICVRLGVTHFIDDRPEVMHYMGNNVTKILMNPRECDVVEYRSREQGHHIVTTWTEIATIFKKYEQ